MIFYVLLLCVSVVSASIPTKPKLTLDEFFNYTFFPSISLSPNGQQLLIHTRQALWESNSYENSLWLYETHSTRRTLITRSLMESFKPQWSPSGKWIVLSIEENRTSSDVGRTPSEQNIYLYCTASAQLIPIPIGAELPSMVTWADNDSSIFFVTKRLDLTVNDSNANDNEWKDVIQHRKRKITDDSTIFQLNLVTRIRPTIQNIVTIRHIPFAVDELMFSSSQQKLIVGSFNPLFEDMNDYELYSIDIRNGSNLIRLTNNTAFEGNLQLSPDGHRLIFRKTNLGPTSSAAVIYQERLYSIDLRTGEMQRLAKDFDGKIMEFRIRPDGGVYILGQLGTNVQIYTQQSPEKYTVLHRGWEGTYESFSSASLTSNSTIAFVHSAIGRPKEVYIVDHLNQLTSAKAITNENHLLTERTLPQAKIYRWISDEDDRTIEGILHYPPGQFESNNLPLLILIHGGPYSANLNQFHANAGQWAALAANEGWLVLEPNYRGSTGYGDQFLDEIRYQPLTRPGRDILSAVDHLVEEGIADRNSLAVGGYSYGGFLTNWLITQTTRFNAALSGSGSVDYVSSWGIMDIPLLIDYLFGGFPWNASGVYEAESPIYHFDKVRTPTHPMCSIFY